MWHYIRAGQSSDLLPCPRGTWPLGAPPKPAISPPNHTMPSCYTLCATCSLPRERIDAVLDAGSPFLELSPLAGHGLYGECGLPGQSPWFRNF